MKDILLNNFGYVPTTFTIRASVPKTYQMSLRLKNHYDVKDILDRVHDEVQRLDKQFYSHRRGALVARCHLVLRDEHIFLKSRSKHNYKDKLRSMIYVAVVMIVMDLHELNEPLADNGFGAWFSGKTNGDKRITSISGKSKLNVRQPT